MVLLGLSSVCIGIYQVSQSRFSCANRGQLVVNCVAECGHEMAVRSRWRSLPRDPVTMTSGIARHPLTTPGSEPLSSIRPEFDSVAVGTIIADRPPHRSARALISACGCYLG